MTTKTEKPSKVKAVGYIRVSTKKSAEEGESLDIQRQQITLPIKEALNYLRSILQTPVPETVLKELRTFSISKTEFFEYRTRTRPPGVLDGLLELYLLYGFYSRQIGKASLIVRIAGFPKFLRHIFGMDRLWNLILYALFELVRRNIQMMSSITRSFQQKIKKR